MFSIVNTFALLIHIFLHFFYNRHEITSQQLNVKYHISIHNFPLSFLVHIIHFFKMYVVSILFKISNYIQKHSKGIYSQKKYERSMLESSKSFFTRQIPSQIFVHILFHSSKRTSIFSCEFNRT